MLRRVGPSEPSYLNAGTRRNLDSLLVANSGPPAMAQCCLERPDRYDGHLHWVPGRFSPTEEEALY